MTIHCVPIPITLRDVLMHVQGESPVSDCVKMTTVIHGIGPVHSLDDGILACLHNKNYIDQLNSSQKGICLTSREWAQYIPSTLIPIYHTTPYRAFASLLTYLFPRSTSSHISDLASISPQAIIGNGCQIGPFVVIDADVQIGDHCIIDSNVTISNATIGNHVRIKPGAKIGQPGFGFHLDVHGPIDMPQLGRVIIGNHVQIGANTTIDRGSLCDTIIGNACYIDNLVQIAHNVVLGDGCILVAQVGIAGSTHLGRFVVVAGQVGIAGHLKIGDHVQIAAQSGVMHTLVDHQKVGGSPAIPIRKFHQTTVLLNRLVQNRKKHSNLTEVSKSS